MTKKDSRIGESLWYTWEGYDYEPYFENSVIYYTEESVDLDNEIVKKALASSIQRDGLVDSLSEAYKLIDSACIVYGNTGFLDGDFIPQICNEFGVNKNDQKLDNVEKVTLVEVTLF